MYAIRSYYVILANEVHHVLGKHRSDDPVREGWISGLSKEEGEVHPTVGGLRIGKKHDERKENDSYNERLVITSYSIHYTKLYDCSIFICEITQGMHTWCSRIKKKGFQMNLKLFYSLCFISMKLCYGDYPGIERNNFV